MLIAILFFWLVLSPVQVIAQEVLPAPTATPSATLTQPPADETPIPGSAATPTSSPPASSTSSDTPTPNPTVNSTTNQTTNSQSNGLGGNGLVEDKEDTTGLAIDDGKVLAATESRDVDSVGDRDLLITLIFLTAAIVLIVWTVYMILVQNGIVKTEMKKEKHKGGITPQPLQ